MSEEIARILTILLSAGGATVLVALINAFFNRKKTKAEADKTTADTMDQYIGGMLRVETSVSERFGLQDERLARLEARVTQLEEENLALRKENIELKLRDAHCVDCLKRLEFVATECKDCARKKLIGGE